VEALFGTAANRFLLFGLISFIIYGVFLRNEKILGKKFYGFSNTNIIVCAFGERQQPDAEESEDPVLAFCFCYYLFVTIRACLYAE
jgi:hypothetical protein